MQWFTNFKYYTLFTVIIKRWLYSLCWTIYSGNSFCTIVRTSYPLPLCCPAPLPSPQWWPLACSLYLWFSFVYVLFTNLLYFLDSTCKQYHIVFIFLWVISLSITPSKLIHIIANGKISFFLKAESCSVVCISVCVCRPHLLLSLHLLMDTQVASIS